ncbi:MAG TPA: tRNA preQ1(34) S-adenosylmethionine ribosyltransferase-isomerase QueA, partial [Deltaproteobacteria bacterium]|nr:tRNA preQ1(34) S-adenosylmethionine ribosyltransferase-isomerase QueA [Deltaproteobacteria bacterium]
MSPLRSLSAESSKRTNQPGVLDAGTSNGVRLQEFNYHLPKDLIAQFPCERRDESRLMVLNRKERTISHKKFFELTDYLKAGDVLVLNNTKVIPARLFGKKTTGGAVEVLLIQKLEIRNQESEISPTTSQIWSCLINPVRGLNKGSEITFEYGLKAAIIEKGVEGEWLIELHRYPLGDRFKICPQGNAGIDIDEIIEKVGNMPLPPYIKRGHGSWVRGQDAELDRERYQTVFAKEKGAVAAPTAGLHFTEELLAKIRDVGVEILYITLHTGLGTFKPVKADNITDHKMEPEYYNIDPGAFEAVKRAKQEKRRIIAVGSTATRALETMVNPPSSPFNPPSSPFFKGGMGGF